MWRPEGFLWGLGWIAGGNRFGRMEGPAGRRPQESGGGAARSRLWVWDLGPVLMGAACGRRAPAACSSSPPPMPLGPGTTLSLATSSTLASLTLERLLADTPVRCPEASWDRPCRPQGELLPIAGPLPSQIATLCHPPTCLCPPSHRFLPSRSPQGREPWPLTLWPQPCPLRLHLDTCITSVRAQPPGGCLPPSLPWALP